MPAFASTTMPPRFSPRWRTILPCLLVAVFVLATGVKHFVFNAITTKVLPPRFATEQEAKLGKRWLGSASAQPDVLSQDFSEFRIEEAWYEPIVQRDHSLVWFPVERVLPGHYLCIRFSAWKTGEYDFYLEGEAEPMSVRPHADQMLYWARREGEPQTVHAQAWFFEGDHLQYDFRLRKQEPLAQVTFTPRDAR